MAPVSADSMSGIEAVRLVAAGGQLVCPTCQRLIRTIPAGWTPGEKLSGLECPTTQSHFLVYVDYREDMVEMRSRMKKL